MRFAHLKLFIETVTLGPVTASRLERADQFVAELDAGSHLALQFTSKLVFHSLNRLQNDSRICLELTVRFPAAPWVSLQALIPLDGDGSLYDSATMHLSKAVHRLAV